MVRQIILLLSLVLQIFAVVIALRLTKATKYRISWILISVGLILMAVIRIIDWIYYFNEDFSISLKPFYDWVALAVSFFITIGILIIPEIFNYIKKIEKARRITEKRILNTIVHTEERERRRFAKDLHDGLGPLLSSVKLSLSALKNKKHDVHETEIIKNMDITINEAIKSIQEISNNLSPHILENYGLERAISNFINKLNNSQQIKYIFTCDGYQKDIIDKKIEITFYRITCELINNTIKHANAKEIVIHLGFKETSIDYFYSDNGDGFLLDPNQHEPFYGMGLQNIISRIESIDGKYQIKTNPDEGFNLTVIIDQNSDDHV